MQVSAVLITRETEWPRDLPLDFPFDEVLLETSCPNVRRRFELASRARNDVIYVQDDDALIDIHHLAAQYDGRLTNAITEHHLANYSGTGITLIGFGCFFPRALLDFSRWQARYGEVDAMEADRIFTWLSRPHNSVVMPIRQLPRRVRMCARPEHRAELQRIRGMLGAL